MPWRPSLTHLRASPGIYPTEADARRVAALCASPFLDIQRTTSGWYTVRLAE